jgi:hypothetical protein
MASKVSASQELLPFPVQVGLALGIVGGIIVALSFWIINYWPQPASVAPYFGARIGFVWGAVVGFSFGCILGFLCDDKHFPQPQA